MLHVEVMKHMDSSELRGYVDRMKAAEEEQGNIRYEYECVIDAFQRLYNSQKNLTDHLVQLTVKQTEMRSIEADMTKKYKEHLPKGSMIPQTEKK